MKIATNDKVDKHWYKNWSNGDRNICINIFIGQKINLHGFGWTPGVGDRWGDLLCCGSWGHKESGMTERLNWTCSSPPAVLRPCLSWVPLSPSGLLPCAWLTARTERIARSGGGGGEWVVRSLSTQRWAQGGLSSNCDPEQRTDGGWGYRAAKRSFRNPPCLGYK